MNIYYVDGACSGNPGPGGYGVIRVRPSRKELKGTAAHTTNNRMELLAVITALRDNKGQRCQIFTDSTYVFKGSTQWKTDWKARNWVHKKTGELIPNADLWQELDLLYNESTEILWVKGHANSAYNNEADALACQARDEMKRKLK